MPWRVGIVTLFTLLLWPGICLASGNSSHAEEHLSLSGYSLPFQIFAILPFVALLLSIAILPLVAEHFWHSNLNRGIVAGAFSVIIIALLYYLEQQGQPGMHALAEGLEEYGAFICLLGSLYVVSGGIVFDMNVKPTPLVNGAILVFGAVIANLIGTTGSSMLLIRPFLRINQSRSKVAHLPIFFIFMVSNLGGLLTPLGDPPLFLGFLDGISFFWTFSLWKQWLFANGMVLGVFLVWDTIAYLRDPNNKSTNSTPLAGPRLSVSGLVNLLFFAGILAAVLCQSYDPAEFIHGYLPNFPVSKLVFPGPEILMIAMALLSLYFTKRGLRKKNGFGWGAIIEVAVLFIGIFITMVPALAILKDNGEDFQRAGLNQPWHYFWLTGLLSGFLDNAPTYKTFASLKAAGSKDLSGLMTETTAGFPEGIFLAAISCGAVFMGAMTYIGNGPNFMVKAISDEQGYKTPSFFGYLGYSACILGPIFVIITIVFFLNPT